MDNAILKIRPYLKYVKRFGWNTDSPAKDTDLAGQFYTVAIEAKQELLKMLKEPCTEHPNGLQVIPKYGFSDGFSYSAHRYLCPDCMKQIEKEINQ